MITSFNWFKHYVEFVILLVLVVGFILSFASESFAVRLILVFIIGLMFGRIWFLYKKRPRFALSLVIAGFLLGFLLGSFFGKAQEIVLVFLTGFFAGYYVHHKKLVKAV